MGQLLHFLYKIITAIHSGPTYKKKWIEKKLITIKNRYRIYIKDLKIKLQEKS